MNGLMLTLALTAAPVATQVLQRVAGLESIAHFTRLTRAEAKLPDGLQLFVNVFESHEPQIVLNRLSLTIAVNLWQPLASGQDNLFVWQVPESAARLSEIKGVEINVGGKTIDVHGTHMDEHRRRIPVVMHFPFAYAVGADSTVKLTLSAPTP